MRRLLALARRVPLLVVFLVVLVLLGQNCAELKSSSVVQTSGIGNGGGYAGIDPNDGGSYYPGLMAPTAGGLGVQVSYLHLGSAPSCATNSLFNGAFGWLNSELVYGSSICGPFSTTDVSLLKFATFDLSVLVDSFNRIFVKYPSIPVQAETKEPEAYCMAVTKSGNGPVAYDIGNTIHVYAKGGNYFAEIYAGRIEGGIARKTYTDPVPVSRTVASGNLVYTANSFNLEVPAGVYRTPITGSQAVVVGSTNFSGSMNCILDYKD